MPGICLIILILFSIDALNQASNTVSVDSVSVLEVMLEPWKLFRNIFTVVYAVLLVLKIAGKRLQVKWIEDELQYMHVVLGFLLMIFSYAIAGLILDVATVIYLMQ